MDVLLTVLQLVNQLFVVVQFQVVNSVDQTLNVSHSCRREDHGSGFHDNVKCLPEIGHNMRLPRSLLIKGWVLKGSKSSMCSPVPIKMMGLRVAATLRGNQNFMALKGPTPTSTDRKMKLVLRAQSSSSFGVSVQFGDNYRSYVDLVFKSFGLRLTGLANGRVHHIHNVVWLLETGSEGHRWVTHQQLKH